MKAADENFSLSSWKTILWLKTDIYKFEGKRKPQQCLDEHAENYKTLSPGKLASPSSLSAHTLISEYILFYFRWRTCLHIRCTLWFLPWTRLEFNRNKLMYKIIGIHIGKNLKKRGAVCVLAFWNPLHFSSWILGWQPHDSCGSNSDSQTKNQGCLWKSSTVEFISQRNSVYL